MLSALQPGYLPASLSAPASALLKGPNQAAIRTTGVPPTYDARMTLTRADPVLAVHDLDITAKWFVDVLGGTKADAEPGNWVFGTSGNVTFMLGRCPDGPPASESGDHNYIACLTVERLDDFFGRARAVDAEVLKSPKEEERWGRREMGLRTPDGHRIMLSERV